jgi:hypothetical protein
MKKVLVLTLALVLALSLVACGGGNSGNTGGNSSTTPPATSDNSTTPPASQGGNSGGENTADDWQAWLKETYGIDFVLPTGWTVRTANINSDNTMDLDLTVGGTITSIDFGQQLMDLTASAASNGNHMLDITENGAAEGTAITSFLDNVTSFLEDKSEGYLEWCYTCNGSIDIITYTYNATSAAIAFHY